MSSDISHLYKFCPYVGSPPNFNQITQMGTSKQNFPVAICHRTTFKYLCQHPPSSTKTPKLTTVSHKMISPNPVDINSIFSSKKLFFALFQTFFFLHFVFHFQNFLTKYFACTSNHSPTAILRSRAYKVHKTKTYTRPPLFRYYKTNLFAAKKSQIRNRHKADRFILPFTYTPPPPFHHLSAPSLKALLFVNAQSVNKRKEINEETEAKGEKTKKNKTFKKSFGATEAGWRRGPRGWKNNERKKRNKTERHALGCAKNNEITAVIYQREEQRVTSLKHIVQKEAYVKHIL